MTATTTADSSPVDSDTENSVAIARYVAAVREALGDVESDELDDLVDDLELHLAEVRADTNRPFEQVIGTPQEFAAELRQSAGFPPPPPATLNNSGLEPGGLLFELQRVGRTVRSHDWVVAVVGFWPELRPGWWVLRGYLLAILLAFVTTFDRPVSSLATPRVLGSSLLGLLAMAGLIVASVRFGRKELEWTAWRRVVVGALAFLGGICLLAWTGSASNSSSMAYTDGPYPEAVPVDDYSVLPANIFAYLPDGTPIDRVLLFNETGAPIDLPESGYSEQLDMEFEAPLRQDSNGQSIPNLYPRTLTAGRFNGVRLADEYPGLAPGSSIEGQILAPPTVNLRPATADGDPSDRGPKEPIAEVDPESDPGPDSDMESGIEVVPDVGAEPNVKVKPDVAEPGVEAEKDVEVGSGVENQETPGTGDDPGGEKSGVETKPTPGTGDELSKEKPANRRVDG